jgi:hypothetical protein
MRELLAEETFRVVAESVETLPPPLEAIRDRARSQRRRRWTSLGAAAAVAALLLGTATWLGTRPGPLPVTPQPAVKAVRNPASVVWWANGQLRLANVSVETPLPTDLAAISGGAVYGNKSGDVVFVGDDGEVTRIGTQHPGAPLVASDERGWVAWVDPGDRSPELVVYDLTARQVLASRPLPAGEFGSESGGEDGHPIAIDQDKIFYVDQDGEHEWTVPDGATHRVQPSGLLAVRQATKVWQLAPATIQIVQPFFSLFFNRSGRGAQLSPDATYVLTRTAVTTESFGAVLIYDARSGDRVWTGLGRKDVVVEATLGPDDEVTYVTANRADQPRWDDYVRQSFSGPYELRTCHLETQTCTAVRKIPRVGVLPVLAH